MKIARVETIPLSFPFETGAPPPKHWAGEGWNRLDMVLVRVETEDGLVGWGDAFAYHCRDAVKAAVDHMIAPRVVGRDAGDIATLHHEMQKDLHLWGRYGITLFALSGLDIALWDIAGKRAGLPLGRLLGGGGRTEVEGYASLFRYGDRELVAGRTKRAVERGFRYVKLHEITEPEVAAARDGGGDAVRLMVDTNCPWTPQQARLMALDFEEYDIHWLEEPIFPPEDFASLAWLRGETGIPIAAGENACTAFQFKAMFEAGAVDFAQPSVTKVGGVTEFRKVATLAEGWGVQVMPHSPYFGPGFLATLQLAAAMPNPGLVERFDLDLEATLYGDAVDAPDGTFRIPDGPGLGREPDPDVMRDYRVK